MSLFVGSEIMHGVHGNEKEGDSDCDQTEDGREVEAKAMECVVMPDRDLSDCFVFECGVALGPAHFEDLKEVELGQLLRARTHLVVDGMFEAIWLVEAADGDRTPSWTVKLGNWFLRFEKCSIAVR